MSEKRKPAYTIMLKKQGKRNIKVEMFLAKKFEHKGLWIPCKPVLYRIRVDGRWYGKGKADGYTFMTKWKFRDLLWRSFLK